MCLRTKNDISRSRLSKLSLNETYIEFTDRSYQCQDDNDGISRHRLPLSKLTVFTRLQFSVPSQETVVFNIHTDTHNTTDTHTRDRTHYHAAFAGNTIRECIIEVGG